jgi:hypothetical protein
MDSCNSGGKRILQMSRDVKSSFISNIHRAFVLALNATGTESLVIIANVLSVRTGVLGFLLFLAALTLFHFPTSTLDVAALCH